MKRDANSIYARYAAAMSATNAFARLPMAAGEAAPVAIVKTKRPMKGASGKC